MWKLICRIAKLCRGEDGGGRYQARQEMNEGERATGDAGRGWRLTECGAGGGEVAVGVNNEWKGVLLHNPSF